MDIFLLVLFVVCSCVNTVAMFLVVAQFSVQFFTAAYLELCALFCLVLCTSLADSVRGTRSTPCTTHNDFGAVVSTFHAPLPYLPTSWQELSCCCLTLELYEFFVVALSCVLFGNGMYVATGVTLYHWFVDFLLLLLLLLKHPTHHATPSIRCFKSNVPLRFLCGCVVVL